MRALIPAPPPTEIATLSLHDALPIYGVELVDLQDASDLGEEAFEEAEVASGDAFDRGDGLGVGEVFGVESAAEALPVAGQGEQRSEGHPSELQSRFALVCRLLLDKKK